MTSDTTKEHRRNHEGDADALGPPRQSPARYQPFPTALLPGPLARLVSEAAVATVCDETYFALPMLSVLAASIGTTRRIRLKSRWCEPSVVWSVVVAPSGTQKSAGPEEASGPLRQRQSEAFKSYNAEMQEHTVSLAKYETARQQWMSRGMSKNETPPPRPAEPQPERHIVQDVTVEALAPILKANPRGLLVLRDELAGWLKSFDAYKSGKGGDAAHWLEMHGARELTVDRKGGDPKTIFVPRAAVSVTGTIQPRVLQESLGREQFESGLAARLLLAMPPRRPKKWTDAEVSPSALEGYRRVVHGLLSLRHAIGPDGAPEPIDLTLTPAGRQAFIDFYTEHAGRQADTGDEDLSAAFSKLEGYAARFALIVHCVRGVIGDPTLADASMIDEDSIGRGVGIARWFASETERIYAEFRRAGTDQEAERIRLWIEGRGGRVTVRDFHRANQQRYAKAVDARKALERLAAAELGAFGFSQDEGRPSEWFDLGGHSDSDKTSDGTPENRGFVNVTGSEKSGPPVSSTGV